MDITDTQFEPESFDYIIDKGLLIYLFHSFFISATSCSCNRKPPGTFDSILCGEESTKNAVNTFICISRAFHGCRQMSFSHFVICKGHMLRECKRALKPKGACFIITYGAPQPRLSHLEKSR